ncbi:uncharacterized protein TRIADDRAFT_1761, partial [Trichoplax adhaerens]
IPDNINLVDFIFQYFDEYGSRVAVVDAKTGHSYTYAQIREFTIKLASALLRLGLSNDDVVAIYAPNIPEYPIVFFGTVLAGGTACIVNPAYSVKELTNQLELSEAKYIFTVSAFLDKAKEAAARRDISNIYVMDNITDSDITLAQELLEDDGSRYKSKKINSCENIAAIAFTDGTTGSPKGVILTHHNIISNVSQAAVRPFFTVDEQDILLALIPWFDIYGMVANLLIGLRFGGKLVSLAEANTTVFLETIQQHKITIATITPRIAASLSKQTLTGNFNVSSLNDVIGAAAPLGKEAQTVLGGNLGGSYRQAYGLTELSPVVAVVPSSKAIIGSVGKLVPHTKGKVVNIETGEALPVGESGELCFKGPQVMKGYLGNQAATESVIDEDGWLHTGDVGYYDESGNLYIVDRLDEFIKYDDFQVAPAELEEVLLTHPKVSDAAVIGIPNIDGGELAKAFVVKCDNDITEKELEDFVASEVAEHKKLYGGVEFIDTLPKSTGGKLLRRRLK